MLVLLGAVMVEKKPTPRPKFSVILNHRVNLPNSLPRQIAQCSLHMASAEARAYNRGLGQCPEWGPRAESLVEVRDEAP